MKPKRQTQGFTLVELMVVVAVIGILAAIAYPSYTRYVERGHLTDAYAELVDINNAIKTKRVKKPSELRTQQELDEEVNGTKDKPKKYGFSDRYEVKVTIPDENSPRYNLVVTPQANKGYTLALWMNSIGEAYRCQDADSAKDEVSAKDYKPTGKCEQIGGKK